MWPGQALRRVSPRFGGSFETGLMRAADVLLTWQERATQRHALASLDARMLGDLGLSRADVRHETSKPFWRA